MYQKAAGVCLAAWLTASIFSGCFFPEYKLLSDDEVTLLQFAPLVSGEELAVVDTTKGSFTMRFFPSEAPQAVENFISLAKEGFYDGKSIYAIAHTEGQQLPVSFVSCILKSTSPEAASKRTAPQAPSTQPHASSPSLSGR